MSILRHIEKYNSRILCFVGFAEFDEVEGPVVSKIVPESFPLDLEMNYVIADHALYPNGKAIYEVRSLLIFAYPFTIEHEALPRKTKKVAVIVAFNKKADRNIILRIISDLEPKIELTITEFLSSIEPPVNSQAEKLVKTIYLAAKKRIKNILLNRFNESESQISAKNLDKILENSAIIDLAFNVVLTKNQRIIDDFMEDPENYLVIRINTKKIAVINKYILREYNSYRLEEIFRVLETQIYKYN